MLAIAAGQALKTDGKERALSDQNLPGDGAAPRARLTASGGL